MTNININVSTGSKLVDLASNLFIRVWIVPFGGLVIALTGALLEMKFGNWYFQRFGSVMVSFVGVVIFTHYHVKKFSETQNVTAENLKNIKANQGRMNQVLSRFPANSHNQIIKAWDELIEKADNLNEKLKRSSKNLAFGEAMVGVVGTLIWGFGDIISCLLRFCRN